MGVVIVTEHPPIVCAGDADVTFESSDHVRFRIHSSNLRCASEGFSPPDGTSSSASDEIVHLTETAEVLELLFQFIYPQRQPNLKLIEFAVLSDLAEAAEKYQVFSAMETCKTSMGYVYPPLNEFPEFS